jgi:hypothetical protein
MKKLMVGLVLMMLLPEFASSQELDATVTINAEQLESASRDRLNSFKAQIESYLNNTKFTSQAWDGDRIKCSFNIFFLSSIDETNYTAQLVVTSQRNIYKAQRSSLMLNILDNAWQFSYQKNQGMYFKQVDFDPLLSFFDYYAYIIIGFDIDSYYSLGGNDYFQKALDITSKGANSTANKGWQYESTIFNRRALLDNLLSSNYLQFRQDFFNYHYNGLDIFNSPEKQTALGNMVKLVKDLEIKKDQIDSRSVLLKVFFDAKAAEIVDYFKGNVDKNMFTTLKKVDPPHSSKYDEGLQ